MQMQAAEILQLAAALVTALGPEIAKLVDEAAHGGDVVGALSHERVESILAETSRIELAEKAALLRRAQTEGHVAAQLAPHQVELVNAALSMAQFARLVPAAA
jgi:hypothetical protein